MSPELIIHLLIFPTHCVHGRNNTIQYNTSHLTLKFRRQLLVLNFIIRTSENFLDVALPGKAACPFCDEKFLLDQVLHKHIATVHARSNLECDVCGMRKSNRSCLRRHLSKHKVLCPQYYTGNALVSVRENGWNQDHLMNSCGSFPMIHLNQFLSVW